MRLLPGTHPFGGEILELDWDHQRKWGNQSTRGSASLNTWNSGRRLHSQCSTPTPDAPKHQWQCGMFWGRQGMIYSPFLSPYLFFTLSPTPNTHTHTYAHMHTHRNIWHTIAWLAWSMEETRSAYFPLRIRNRPLPNAHHDTNQKCKQPGTSLVVQWLGLHAPNLGCLGSVPCWAAGSHMLQLRLSSVK